MKNPWMYTPCAGTSGRSFVSRALVTKIRTTWKSSGCMVARAFTCITAVKNDIGLKNPATHNDFSKDNASVHSLSCATRRIKSANQLDSGFKDGYARFSQPALTLLVCRSSARASIMSVTLRAPEIPNSNSSRLRLISARRTFMRSDSCRDTITYGVRPSMRPRISNMSSSKGNVASKLVIIAVEAPISPPPPPPPPPPDNLATAPKILFPWLVKYPISALECKPNI
mmetsp:Transcript_34949/g.84429  ORF Transcript_34949/g.84429 Transcript_34949/m.84429 type:complete len:227 (-) Transcript_34949:1428-2108(-)